MKQKSVKKNTIFSILKTTSSIIFPLITFPYVSRVLLTENVGKVNFSLSIVSYFNLIASLGISTYAIRECSGVRDDCNKLNEMASQIFSINIITTVIAYIALATTLLLYRKLDNYRLLIIIQSLSIIATTLGADWLNSAMEDFRYITLRSVIFQVISLLLLFVFVHRAEDYLKYAIISLVSSAGANITNIWYRRRYCRITFTLSINWKKHLMPILFLFVMSLAQTIFNSVDSTMLGVIHGDYEVGLYTTAHKIMYIISQAVSSLALVIMPRMAYYFAENDWTKINSMLRKVLNYNIAIGLPCCVGIIVMADDVIMLSAGDSYMMAIPVLKILMIGFVFTLIGGNFLGNAILLPSKGEKYYMIVCLITAALNVIGNRVMIPIWGANGAAITTAACCLAIMLLLMLKVDKRIKIDRLHSILVPSIIGSVLIIIVCLVCRTIPNIWVRDSISIIVSVILYGAIQIVCKNDIVVDIIDTFKAKLTNW